MAKNTTVQAADAMRSRSKQVSPSKKVPKPALAPYRGGRHNEHLPGSTRRAPLGHGGKMSDFGEMPRPTRREK